MYYVATAPCPARDIAIYENTMRQSIRRDERIKVRVYIVHPSWPRSRLALGNLQQLALLALSPL